MAKKLIGELELNRIYQRDCIEGMRLLPDDSVDLIIADPPYYKIKGDFDFIWRTMDEYLAWCAEWLKECERVLSPKGSLYLYGMELQLEYVATIVDKTTDLEYRNRITLNKPSYVKDLYGSQAHFRKFIPVAEYLLFYTFADGTLSQKESDASITKSGRSIYLPIVEYLRSEYEATGLSKSELKDICGNTAFTHYFSYGSWRFPTEQNYRKLQTTGRFNRAYSELKSEFDTLKEEYRLKCAEYESQRYTFNAKDGMTNVWDFVPDRGKVKTKHPTQKPLSICEQVVSISSNEGDTVLIPFVGSGSECVAATRLNRHFIGFELESEYIEIANKRLDNEISPE